MDSRSISAAPGIQVTNPEVRRALKYLVIVLMAVALGALWLWSQGAERRGIRALPEPEQRAFYERTLQTLQSPSCRPPIPSEGLRNVCREQAKLIREFPQCDDACWALSTKILANPVR